MTPCWICFSVLLGILVINNVNCATDFNDVLVNRRATIKKMGWNELINLPLKDLMQLRVGEDDTCKDEHPKCKENQSVCGKDTYAVMMVYLCPLTCNLCDARKHFPDSGLACTDHTPRCVKKSHKDKCGTDEEIKKSCPWTCKICTDDEKGTAEKPKETGGDTLDTKPEPEVQDLPPGGLKE